MLNNAYIYASKQEKAVLSEAWHAVEPFCKVCYNGTEKESGGFTDTRRLRKGVRDAAREISG